MEIYAGSAARLLKFGSPTEMFAVRYTLAHPIRLELLIKAELGQPFVDRKTRILHDEYNYEADRVNID